MSDPLYQLKAEQLANADDISKRFSQDELINFIESQKLLFAEVERQQAAQRQQRLEAGLNAEAPLEPLNIDPEVQKRVQQSILAAKEAGMVECCMIVTREGVRVPLITDILCV